MCAQDVTSYPTYWLWFLCYIELVCQLLDIMQHIYILIIFYSILVLKKNYTNIQIINFTKATVGNWFNTVYIKI